jgi:hypothetical protein
MIVLLATPEMLSTRPDDVKIVHDWGDLTIHIEPKPEEEIYDNGYHVAIEGPTESIKDWLRPYKNIWIGVGSPIMQEFEVRHID